MPDGQNTPRTAEDPTEAILSKSGLNEKYLCDYVLNVASGCSHGCSFCYVPSTPNIRTRGEMLKEQVGVDDGQEEWGDYVLYRDDIPDRLEKKLSRKRTWRETDGGQGIVGMSFHTDCFMDPRAADISSKTIQILGDYEKYTRVLTRNPKLANHYQHSFEQARGYVTIGTSIPTLDEEAVSAIEQNAPPVESRLSGLKEFADAGFPTFISLSPTYPTIDSREQMETLLETVATVDPDVIFHEPVNQRGANFQMTVDAAWDHGRDALGSQLAKIRDQDAWRRHSLKHHAWVQELGEKHDLPVHLWPDSRLMSITNSAVEAWLREWYDRQSPEPFAGRPTPDSPMPEIPDEVASLSL
jgi:DNA repair photolyase